MNDDLVVQKILKLLENNTAFIGYALNGGIGTKINVRNTETGKTIQALSINVDSSGEVLVVKDSDDGKYKAVTFKAAQQTTERIIQIRKTKPVDDKKIIEYTDSDIEVFYLFVKLIDTGNPVESQLTSTWIRKGSSCTQFVGAYERCNYAAKETIGGTSYTGLPYKPYSTLNDCLNDDLGRDAKTPHGSGDENGANPGWKMYSTQVSASGEEAMLAALTSHDSHYKTNYKRGFGYATILDCSGAMNLAGWEAVQVTDPLTNELKYIFRCEFSYLPGYTNDCTPAMREAGYCDSRGFISSRCPLPGQEEPGKPSVGNIQNDWGHTYGWKDLPYEFMYKRHFQQLYLNGATAPGSFYILEVNDDQVPGTLPPNYFPWNPGCPSNLGDGGPYNGGGGNRFPDGPAKPKKRDMKLSTHKAEIWLGSSKKEEAIKLYELGASDLFSGMYNAFIIKADETRVDIENRLKRGFTNTVEEQFQHEKFYENWNKNLIDLTIDPRVWIYVLENKPSAASQLGFHEYINPQSRFLQLFIDSLYNRTLNLSIIDKKTQVVYLKLGLTPKNTLSNTDCKGANNGREKGGDSYCGQSWEYQKSVTIKIKDWKIDSTTNNLNTTLLDSEIFWNKDYIERKYLTSFGTFQTSLSREIPFKLLLRHDLDIDVQRVVEGNHFEQFNYLVKNLKPSLQNLLYIEAITIKKKITTTDFYKRVGINTISWWELWNKTIYNKKTKRLSSVVGYDINNYQIIRNSGLSSSLNFTSSSGTSSFSNTVGTENYYGYLPTKLLEYSPSRIRGTRNKLITNAYPELTDRQVLLSKYGLLFYFSNGITRWSVTDTPTHTLLPNGSTQGFHTELLSSMQYNLDNESNGHGSAYNTGNTRGINTRRWFNNLWAQIVYDGSVKVDVDSYKNVEFNLPDNPSQYIKFAVAPSYADSEYNFTLLPSTTTELETVLTPGVLDVTKQVPIKKPTNVELDPNYSFLVYLYPFVEVTKKKKEI